MCTAEKQGGGTSLFGRKTWKERCFVIDIVEGRLAYFASEEAANCGVPPVKTPLNISHSSVELVQLGPSADGKFEVSRQ